VLRRNIHLVFRKFLRVPLLLILLCLVKNADVFAQAQSDYLTTLFNEVETREKNPEHLPPRLYDKLINDAISTNLLKHYPSLIVGKIAFVSRLSQDLAAKEDLIIKGQDLILNTVIPPEMRNNSLRFKDVIDQIDAKLQDQTHPLSDQDWIVIASAFRTLKAPDATDTPNALGIVLAEHIILQLIYNEEQNQHVTKEEDELLSDKYYILSQIYQNIYNHPDKYHFVRQKKAEASSPLYLALSQPYLSEDMYDEYIEPITDITIEDYDIIYPDPYSYYVFPSLPITFDILLERRLLLLGNAVIVTPSFDPGFASLAEIVAVDLTTPIFVSRLSPSFYASYFPLGLYGVDPFFLRKLHHRWQEAIARDPQFRKTVRDPQAITNRLNQMQTPSWKGSQRKIEEKSLRQTLQNLPKAAAQEKKFLKQELKQLPSGARQEKRYLEKEIRALPRALPPKERKEKQHLEKELRGVAPQIKQEKRQMQQEIGALPHQEKRERKELRHELRQLEKAPAPAPAPVPKAHPMPSPQARPAPAPPPAPVAQPHIAAPPPTPHAPVAPPAPSPTPSHKH